MVAREDEGELERVISDLFLLVVAREDEGEQNESFLTRSACWWLLRWREDECEQEQVSNDSFLLVVPGRTKVRRTSHF